MITQQELKENFDYNKETGLFTRIKPQRNNKFKSGTIAGSLNNIDGYVRISFNKKRYPAHRLAFLYVNGYMPEHQVDHINQIRNDNRWINIRCVTQQDNLKNSSIRSDNTSGVQGVTWIKKRNKWFASIYDNGKPICLGYFNTIEEAKVARELAKKEYNYGPNHS